MPELPGELTPKSNKCSAHHTSIVSEVERAAALIRSIGTGKRIKKVETVADTIVFSGMTHEDFVCFFIANDSAL